MSTVSELIVASVGGALGCIVGVLFDRSLPDRKRGSGITFGDNNVILGDITNSETFDDNRQWVTIELKQVARDAVKEDSKASRARPRRASTSSGSGDGEDWLTLVGIVVVVGILAVLYMRYHTQVIEILVGMTFASLGFLTTSLALAARRKVRFDTGVRVENVVAVTIVLSVFFDAYFLYSPPLFHGNGGFNKLVALGREKGMSVFLDHYGEKGFLFIAYQLLGVGVAVLVLLMAVLAASRTLAVVSALKRGRAGRLGTALIAGGAKPPVPSIVALVLAAVAVVLTTGGGYSWLGTQQVQLPGTTTTSTDAPSPERPSATESSDHSRVPTHRPTARPHH